LGILIDKNGKRLKDYHVVVENDELIITDHEGNYFNYNPKDIESQRVQETFFHEKQTIIENCLFGVDINPNSVKICQLRLWIELLKNAYYITDVGVENFRPLQTLPNIDINIKCGNSLMSRFDLQQDIENFPNHIRQTIKKITQQYKDQVIIYKCMNDKGSKKRVREEIARIRNTFREIFDIEDIDYRKLVFAETEERHFRTTISYTDEEESRREKHEQLMAKVNELKEKIQQKMKPYANAFEWRFEFPEVLDEDGNFMGFDVVIGNPPYISIEDITWNNRKLYETIYKTATGRFDLYSLFIEKAIQIKKTTAPFSFIVPGKFLNNKQFVTARKFVCENHGVSIVKIDDKVFDKAQVNSVIIVNYPEENAKYRAFNLSHQKIQKLSETDLVTILQDKEIIFRLEFNATFDKLISKIEENTLRVKQIGEVKDGIIAGRLKDILFIVNKKDEDSHKLYFGKHLSKYHLCDTDIWVNYKPDEMMKEELLRQNGKSPGLRMREKKVFEREKILSRFVAKEIIATYDAENKYYEHTLHSTYISDMRFNTKYVLGLFNSKLFKFYYQKTNSQGGDIFPQVRISSVENLPIKIVEQQQPLITLVSQILSLKKENPAADTSALEREIDALVYELYNLTDEEIKIIEGGSSPKD